MSEKELGNTFEELYQYCITENDGSCSSTDPRCMHNKANNKKLLILAADAINGKAYLENDKWMLSTEAVSYISMPKEREWNPLENFNDAIELAVLLNIEVKKAGNAIMTSYLNYTRYERITRSEFDSIKFAITKMAAFIKQNRLNFI